MPATQANDYTAIALGQVNPNVNSFGIDRGSRTFAQDTQAALVRSNWDQTRGLLTPLIGRMQYDYFNPEGRQEAVQEASQAADRGFTQARDQFARDARSTGISLAPDQQAEIGKRFDYAQGTAKVDAMNRAGRSFDDRKNMIALGA